MRRVFLHLPLLRINTPGLGACRAWFGGLAGWLLITLMCLGLGGVARAQAQGVELKAIKLERHDTDLTLDFSLRLTLGAAIEDALRRGVPMYFVAQANVYRNRWYWRDERVARAVRTWRLAYQPLTASWRVGTGGLSQGYATLAEAMSPLSRVSGWHLLDAEKLDPAERNYVEFSFRLDNSQLPQPMQIDLGGDWKINVERTLRVE